MFSQQNKRKGDSKPVTASAVNLGRVRFLNRIASISRRLRHGRQGEEYSIVVRDPRFVESSRCSGPVDLAQSNDLEWQ